jgi:integrase
MARRGWGEDSIYWWEARKRFVGEVSRGYNADGKRIRKKVYGRTKTEVRDKLKELKQELDAQQDNRAAEPIPPPEVTVRQCAETWLCEGLTASPKTARKNRHCLIPVLAAIGDKQLRGLSAGDVQRALSQMAATRASSTVSVAHSALTRAIRYAEARDLVGRNVATLVDTPKGQPGRRSRSLTLDQAVAVIATASQDRPLPPVHPGLRPQEPRPAALMHAYIVVSLTTGLRTEEIRELRWDHVVAWADGQWQPVTAVGWKPEQFAVLVWRSVREDGETKTELSRCSLELPQIAVQALMEWQLAQADERLAAEVRWQDTGLVFTTSTGTSLAAGHVRRMFKNVCKTAGIGENWTPRELRHSFVSLMSDRGMATEEIARLVGHRSTRTTETVYRHELRPVIRSGAAIMNKIFSKE